jgi:hypothetical protein
VERTNTLDGKGKRVNLLLFVLLNYAASEWTIQCCPPVIKNYNLQVDLWNRIQPFVCSCIYTSGKTELVEWILWNSACNML